MQQKSNYNIIYNWVKPPARWSLSSINHLKWEGDYTNRINLWYKKSKIKLFFNIKTGPREDKTVIGNNDKMVNTPKVFILISSE